MREVALVLKIKPGTIAYHKYRMMTQLGLNTNAELIQYAIKQRMIAVA